MSYADVYLKGTIQIPSSLQINSITKGYPAVVSISVNTDTEENTLQAGQLVTLFIPFGYGMQQANGNTYEILSVSGNDITLNLNSYSFDAFSVPSSGEKPATMTPSGSRNLQFDNTTRQVPFQSLNNLGN